jgi:hypothetical protein
MFSRTGRWKELNGWGGDKSFGDHWSRSLENLA